MKNSKTKNLKIFFLIIILFAVFGVVENSEAEVLFETTYDCADWIYDGTDPVCDGLEKGLQYECYSSPATICDYEQITASANNPNGGGGKGQFHPVAGNNIEQSSNAGGGTVLDFDTSLTEFWLRFYVKFESGMNWYDNLANIKLFYFHQTSGSEVMVPKFTSTDSFGFHYNAPEYQTLFSNYGWATVMGGSTGDGEWHYIEYHIKVDTNGTDGEIDLWIDDMAVASAIGRNFNMYGNGYDWVQLMGNTGNVNGEWDIYLDDVVIATPDYSGFVDDGDGNQRIGPIVAESSDTTPPSHPTGLSVE